MKPRTIFAQLIVIAFLAAVLGACGESEPQPTATVVISGPDIRPTEVHPPTPTLRTEMAPTVDEIEAPATEAEPAVEDSLVEEAVPTTAPEVEEPLPEVVEEPTLAPTAAPPRDLAINGMPASEFIIMSPAVRENVQNIYGQGKAFGRNPDTFSILGDSLIATPQSLAQWDQAAYNLGEFAYLQPTIDHYAGSFGRYGPSVRVGLHSWSVFDPLWADKEFCQPNEDVLTCEIRLNNPSIMLVFLGSNDSAAPGGFKINYRQVIQALASNGVVPILATKADRFEGPDNANNMAVREVAAELQVPLLEFDQLANTLPGRGLGPDNVHLTFLEPLDYNTPGLMAVGYPVHNLAVLMILDEVHQALGG